ncbi:DNA repair protein RecN [Coralloluteibacterium stylophorae]|uniref:DNA repair protein RecN n=1 Tax=Coralloluteibacterium stylophorae TaxID=1776034 RepID=A0A8J7VY67_9GAMM|nr:DNA repair protein RecN [Coralloluteibacterium stylophorae]MBS7455936.1 DNA repair protein RecN [Coralloluteibacterium stylophorae]
MLTRLQLKDFAVASSASVSFGAGLTVVSGETGAGKSLLVDALLLLTGSRADSGMVRHGAARAELEAEFELADAPAAAAWLADAELDEDGLCQVRRVVRADGGSRAWINGRAATIAQLGELGGLLVEIHGQHEHQALLSRTHQLALVDGFGGHDRLLSAVREAAQEWHALARRQAELARDGDPSARLDWLQHQYDELEAEALAPESIDELLAAHRRQANAAGLLQGCDRAVARLSGDEGFAVAPLLRQAHAELAQLAADEPALGEAVGMLDAAQIQIDEAAALVERLRDGFELDPDRLQEMEARLTRLHELGRKHRVPIEALAERRETLGHELEALRAAGADAASIAERMAAAQARWRTAADALGAARAKTAKRLAAQVETLMHELGMGGGRFEIALEPNAGDTPDPQGGERAELMVSANPGQPPRPLRKVASGGELSRISLAIEVATLDADAVPTMVFDEVDTGIGGAVAEVVGQKLRALGARRQALCVTHLPQVAAQGHGHYRVSKDVSAGTTHSQVTALDSAARTEEIARMLGGLDITETTLAHARQMLERAQAA